MRRLIEWLRCRLLGVSIELTEGGVEIHSHRDLLKSKQKPMMDRRLYKTLKKAFKYFSQKGR